MSKKICLSETEVRERGQPFGEHNLNWLWGIACKMDEHYVTEIPSSLKQLARLVVRGFYNIEDALIVDMLVRNPCMKEDDICELLKFERKMLRSKIATLRNDKFIQVRLKMETGLDGKAQKVNYYFINYKVGHVN